MSVNDLSPSIVQVLSTVEKYMRDQHELFRHIPFKPKSIGFGRTAVTVTLPEAFLDDGEIHGGLFTILLDTLLAASAWTRMEQFMPLATINLKTDFYESVPADATVDIHAHCDRIVNEVAFCHGQVIDNGGTVLAHAAGTFMVGGSSSGSKESRL